MVLLLYTSKSKLVEATNAQQRQAQQQRKGTVLCMLQPAPMVGQHAALARKLVSRRAPPPWAPIAGQTIVVVSIQDLQYLPGSRISIQTPARPIERFRYSPHVV